jgi:superfamily II DNA or RNA helicase
MARSSSPSTLDPDLRLPVKARKDDFHPHHHQEEAWDALTRHFQVPNRVGILVVPTGGGKTTIASHWLLKHRIAQGCRVLWLAHRRSLLRQAFRDFAFNAHLAAPQSQIELIRVSSEDRPWSGVAAQHNAVFASIQATALEGNSDFLNQLLHQSPRGLFVVIDEAHHAAAPSYFRVLSRLKLADAPLLGLTATPLRSDADDEARLWEVFDRSVIYQVSRQVLIARGVLAVPRLETVRTGVEADLEFTPEDLAELGRLGDLGPAALERLGQNARRNRVIVEHYARNQGRYGKTIVFATDVLHARTLADEFTRVGVKADYVDYQRGDNQRVMDAFRNKADPVVLVNVEMLTEGFDAPRTRTAFLARPTRSEALLAQMIGRALRGDRAGGNPEAYLVTFVDTWREFSPLDPLPIVIPELPAGEPESARTSTRKPTFIPWEVIAAAYEFLRARLNPDATTVHECLPEGWYAWEEETGDDFYHRVVVVFRDQVEGFERLLRDWQQAGSLPATVTEDFAREMRRRYFADTPDPLPPIADLLALLRACPREGAEVGRVVWSTFEEKRAFDPKVLAGKLKDLPDSERAKRLEELFKGNATCRSVYREDLGAFMQDVQAAGGPCPPQPPPEAEDPSNQAKELPGWPAGHKGYALPGIWDQVVSRPGHFPCGVPHVASLAFTSRRLASYWGIYRYSDRSIRLNAALNSPGVPLFVVEFVLYHEALHADMPSAGHGPEFRSRERRFVPSAGAIDDARAHGIVAPGPAPAGYWRALADQFLDTLHRKYRVGGGSTPRIC